VHNIAVTLKQSMAVQSGSGTSTVVERRREAKVPWERCGENLVLQKGSAYLMQIRFCIQGLATINFTHEQPDLLGCLGTFCLQATVHYSLSVPKI